MNDMNYLSRRAEGIWMVLKQHELPDKSIDMRPYYRQIEKVGADDRYQRRDNSGGDRGGSFTTGA
jgi:hypothetical protein